MYFLNLGVKGLCTREQPHDPSSYSSYTHQKENQFKIHRIWMLLCYSLSRNAELGGCTRIYCFYGGSSFFKVLRDMQF